jgi:hypothetical protein
LRRASPLSFLFIYLFNGHPPSISHNSHKRKNAAPRLVVVSTSSSVSSRSADQRQQQTRIGVVSQDAGPLTAPDTGSYWEDDLETNRARVDPGFTYRLGDKSLSSQADKALDDGIQVVVRATRYTNSVGGIHNLYIYLIRSLYNNRTDLCKHGTRTATNTWQSSYSTRGGEARRCTHTAWECAATILSTFAPIANAPVLLNGAVWSKHAMGRSCIVRAVL